MHLCPDLIDINKCVKKHNQDWCIDMMNTKVVWKNMVLWYCFASHQISTKHFTNAFAALMITTVKTPNKLFKTHVWTMSFLTDDLVYKMLKILTESTNNNYLYYWLLGQLMSQLLVKSHNQSHIHANGQVHLHLFGLRQETGALTGTCKLYTERPLTW